MVWSYFGYEDEVMDCYQQLTLKTRSFIKGEHSKALRRGLVPHRWHPYSELPLTLRLSDITREHADRDKDAWRYHMKPPSLSDVDEEEDEELSLAQRMKHAMKRGPMKDVEAVKTTFADKIIVDNWNDKKIKNKEDLVQAIANTLKENIKCDNTNKWTAWCLIMLKEEYEFDWSTVMNVYYYQEFDLPEDYICVLAARYCNGCVYPTIVTKEIREKLEG